MYPQERQKMCTSCDGRIPLDVETCPYCAADQRTISMPPNNPKELHHRSLQDSLTSLYTPSYTGKNPSLLIPKTEPPKEPMAEKRFNHSSPFLGTPTIPVDSAIDPHVDGGKSSFWPILLLSVGTNLLTMGLLQLFFSDNGFLRLEWDSNYWFAYCLAALPLFFFGFRKVNALK
jgi:hypothetical protein